MIGLLGVAVVGCARAPAEPTPTPSPVAPSRAWWPEDARYHEAALHGFGEDLVAEGLATEVRAVDCAEYPCLVHVSAVLPKDRYDDVSLAMSYQDAEFVRRERKAGYLPGGNTTVLDTPEGWAVSHVVAGLARPIDPDEAARLDARIERILAVP